MLSSKTAPPWNGTVAAGPFSGRCDLLHHHVAPRVFALLDDLSAVSTPRGVASIDSWTATGSLTMKAGKP